MATSRPTLLLVTGPPGTGKSTVSEAGASMLSAPVLGWDWVMAGLRPFGPIQGVLDHIEPAEHRRVGWSMLWSLANAQMRAGRSVVLDGTARAEHVQETRALADQSGAKCVVVATSCSNIAVHRQRVDGRMRDIPGWYELDWDHVAKFLEHWTEPSDADLYLDAVHPLPVILAELTALLSDPTR